MIDFAHDDGQDFRITAHYRIMCAALLIWWSIFIYRSFEMTSIGRDAMATTQTEQGSPINQALIVVLAGLGAYHLPAAWQTMRSKEGRTVTGLLLLYSGWCVMSLFWSDDRSIGSRRLLAFILLMVGCYGIGAGFYGRIAGGAVILGRHAVYAGFVATAILLPPRLQNLSLSDLVNPTFNVKDTIEYATISFPAGYAFVAAVAVYRWQTVWRWMWLAFSLAVLLFMKGRSMITATLATGAILASQFAMPGVRTVLMTFGVLQTAFIVDLGTGGKVFLAFVNGAYDTLGAVLPWVSMGDGLKNLTSLSGRVPLWNAVYGFIGDRPILGFGFGTFWTAEHLDQIFVSAGWHATAAHNGFLDEILATGMVGLALFMAFWFYGMTVCLRVARQQDETSGHMVFAWMLMYLLFNTTDTLNQSWFKAPVFFTIAALFAAMRSFVEETPYFVLEPLAVREHEPAAGRIGA